MWIKNTQAENLVKNEHIYKGWFTLATEATEAES